MKPRSDVPQPRRAQRGAVLLFAMIALVVLLDRHGGADALDEHLAVHRWQLRLQARPDEPGRACDGGRARPGADRRAGHDAARQADSTANNYSASVLPTNAQGVPTGAADRRRLRRRRRDRQRHRAGRHGRDRALRRRPAVRGRRPGHAGRLHAGRQRAAGGQQRQRAAARRGRLQRRRGAVAPQVVYRVSIRVDGPRRTQSFFQSTFTI